MMPKQVFIGADHGGYELKERLKSVLTQAGYQVEDCGAFENDPQDDYPQFSLSVAEKVKNHPGSLGVLACRSAGGVIIAANKVPGIRAVAVNSEAEAVHARQHNDAQILGVAGDYISPELAEKVVLKFLTTDFSEEERHARRIAQISEYEQRQTK